MKTLREIIKEVNKVLEENMKKEVISTGGWGYGYDTVRGRTYFEGGEVAHMIREILKDLGIVCPVVAMDRDTKISMLDMKLKLKKKRSGLINDWSRSERMTVIKVEPVEEYPNLDRDIIEVAKEYLQVVKEREEERENGENKQVKEFKEKLQGYDMNIKEFFDLMEEYENFNYNVKSKLEEKRRKIK